MPAIFCTFYIPSRDVFYGHQVLLFVFMVQWPTMRYQKLVPPCLTYHGNYLHSVQGISEFRGRTHTGLIPGSILQFLSTFCIFSYVYPSIVDPLLLHSLFESIDIEY
jgi:hypothetical protein